MTEIQASVYEMVTEKPREFVAYRVRDFYNDLTVDVNYEARRCAALPGVQKAAVEYDWSGQPVLVVTLGNGDSERMGNGGWLVIRPNDAPLHPRSANRAMQRDMSGRIMAYDDAEFNELYSIRNPITAPPDGSPWALLLCP